jgi:hypothetical protein
MPTNSYGMDNIANYSISPIQGSKVDFHKNNTITIIPTSNKNESILMIDGLSINFSGSDGKYYTPLLPYNVYNSLRSMAIDIIDFVPIYEINQTRHDECVRCKNTVC